nr:putative UPF0481 protein At3g02645 [Tanacetum cinerariifolium]
MGKIEFPKFYGNHPTGWVYRCNQFFKVDVVEYDQKEDPMSDLKNIRSKGGTIQIYIDAFDMLMTKVEVPETQAISFFLGGLDKEINLDESEYMGLMCALIVNVEDAKYLREKDVIKGELENDEVVKLFTGMANSITIKKTKEKSKLQEMIDEVNTVYEKGLTMKSHSLLKKLARWLLVGLRAIGGFVEGSWKMVAFMVSIVTVFMLTWKAYCDVYGCDKTTVTLLPYASS